MKRAFQLPVALAVAIVLCLSGVAFADVTDGDLIGGIDDRKAAGVGDELDLIVKLWLERAGRHPAAAVAWGTPVLGNSGQSSCDWISVTAPSPQSLSVPTGWSSMDSGTETEDFGVYSTATITGTVPAAAAGKTCQIKFPGSGDNVRGGDYTAVIEIAPAPAAVTPGTPPPNAAPTLNLPADMTVEGNTTNGADVTFSVSATDAEDGALTPNCDADSGGFFALGGPHTVSCSVTDSGGLSDGGSFTVTVVDTTAPVLSGMPADQAATATGSDGAVVSWTAPAATDTVDAGASTTCSPASGSTFRLGATTVSCTASDASGNTSAAQTFTVTVTYSWSNYLQPINTDGSSTFKQGSTIPVKFALTGASAGVVDATARIHVAKVSNGVLGTEAEATTSTPASSGSLFRYADGQYVYNYGTKGLEAGTYRIRVDLGDGVTTRTVLVSLRK